MSNKNPHTSIAKTNSLGMYSHRRNPKIKRIAPIILAYLNALYQDF
jgi:hypothetical protein